MSDPLGRIESLYPAVRLRPVEERAALLAEARSDDDRLRRESNPYLKNTLRLAGF